MKPCPYCGKMTSAKANFCWWCTRELAARPERPEASSPAGRLRLPAWGWALVAAGIVGLVILFLVFF